MYNQFRHHVYRPDVLCDVHPSKFYYVTWINGRRFQSNRYLEVYRAQVSKGSKHFSITCYLPQPLKDIKIFTEYWEFQSKQLNLFAYEN